MNFSNPKSPPSPLLFDAALPEERLGLKPLPGVSFAALRIRDSEEVIALLAEAAETLPVGTGARKRRAEFLAGRHAAEIALTGLGFHGRVHRALDGVPIWPDGTTGSISHGAERACAAVGERTAFRAIGIDVERVLAQEEAHEIASSVASTEELGLLHCALPDASFGQRLSLLFSAKESLFKTLYPTARKFMEFSDARLAALGLTSEENGVLALRIERDDLASFSAGFVLDVHFFLGTERVETLGFLESS